MKYIELFENWGREERIILTSRQGREIVIEVKHGKIDSISNESGVPFPYFEGQPVTVFMKSWACNYGFKWNGKSACDPGEKKIFGVKAKYIPKEHEWRKIWPNKFREE